MRRPAPFHAEVAGGPAPDHCLWLRTGDGIRLRAGYWTAGDKGTVVLLPGRTEYVEKYAGAAGDLRDRGYAMVAIDWRGQGLADRPLGDRDTGHVNRFTDYQLDLAAVMEAMAGLDMPRPLYLIGHSMGGAIGLRALYGPGTFNAAVFSAPMWGIAMPRAMRPVAWALSTVLREFGHGQRYTPGSGPVTYVAEAPFEDNTLTTDPDMWAMMRRQVTEHPELSLGGPSMHWLNEALHECRNLTRRKPPEVPTLVFLGGNERIVNVPSVEHRVATWPGAKLERVAGAEHEIMMEGPGTRKRFFDAAAEQFEKYR